MRFRFDFPHPSAEITRGGARTPLEFGDPLRQVVAHAVAEVEPVMRAAEAAARSGAWVAGFLSYEAASGFDPSLTTHARQDLPLAWFGTFDRPAALRKDVEWLPRTTRWQRRISEEEYRRGCEAVEEAIASGDTYQTNYTFTLDTRWEDGDVWGRYGGLLAAHRPPFAACLDLDQFAVLSLSPELLLHRRGRGVTSIPMKGTAPRGRWHEEDVERERALADSTKDRAENVMIVDLVRNDLARVCEIGSVAVSSLFDLERYRTAWQMVSTVTGTLREDISLTDAIKAVFPAGSITGAPKVSTMELIRQIEPGPRGIYCGSIGLLAPGGDAIFNVAIRTAVLDRGSGRVSVGVGGGITWDSAPANELAEAHLKATFLEVPPQFALLETVRFDGRSFVRWPQHLARLLASASYFGISVMADRLAELLATHAAQWFGHERRVRVTVTHEGLPEVTSAALEAIDSPISVALSTNAVDSSDPFLFHKTTHREAYDSRRGMRSDVFDVLLKNNHEELTEFTIGNVVLELDDELLTPPRDAGLLAGVFRAELLSQGIIREKRLTPEDLERATKMWLINSVREWLPAELVP